MTTTDISHLNPELNPKFGQMSNKYVLMNSQELVQGLLNLKSKGEPVFELRSIQFRKSRSPRMQYVGSHLIRIRTRQSFNVGKDDAVYPEILIRNSYDGHSQFEVRMGIFRLVCSNGLVIQTQDFGEIKLRHMGTPAEAAFDIAKQFAANLPKFQEVQNAFTQKTLTDEEMVEFATKAAAVRFKEKFTESDAETLLASTRDQDNGNDLWKVFNRVQEKLMRGGIKFESMKKKVKGINRAQEDIRINKELFELAMSYVNSDPEANPTNTEEEFEEVDAQEVVQDLVDEIADLEAVEVDVLNVTEEAPAKMVKHPATRRMIPNPLYNKWLREAKAAGLV